MNMLIKSSNLPISLDNTAQQKGNAPVDLSAKNPEEIVELLLHDQGLQRALSRQDRANEINLELASETLSFLNDAEGTFYEESKDGLRFLNWEVQDIPYRVLRRAADTEPARVILNKRRLDLNQYGEIPKEEGVQRGFKLKFCKKNYSPSKEEKARLEIWTQKFVDTFFYATNDDMPSLNKFLGVAYEDWFTYDDITIEIRRDGLGMPLAMHIQDPIIYKPVIKKRTLPHISSEYEDFLSDSLKDFSNYRFGENIFNVEDNIPDYIGIYQNYEFAQLTRNELIKSHFFIQSHFRRAKRGYSVVEQGLNLIAWLKNALTMNASNFTKNRVPDGLLVLPGVGQFNISKLQKVLSAYINGTTDSHRLPMIDIQSKDGKSNNAQYLNLRGSSREMEYHLWWSLLFSAWCMFSGTDPNEVAMSSHKDAVGKRSLFNDSTDGIIKESKDIGAKTFLSHLANTLNSPAPKWKKNVFQQLTGLDVECTFLGFEVEDKKLKYEIYDKELKSTASINEQLAREDKEKHELMVDLGDGKIINIYDLPAINNPEIQTIIQTKMNQAQQAQMAEEQAALAGGEEEESTDEDELTDADKELLDEYGDRDDVSIDDDLKKRLAAEELEEEELEEEDEIT